MAAGTMHRSEVRDALSRAILGGDPVLTSAQVAHQVGIEPAEAERLWRALGFPDAGDNAAFVGADAEALALVRAAVDRGIIDMEMTLRLTRALGNTMSRLADWQVSTLVESLEPDVTDSQNTSRAASALSLTESVGPAFEQLLVYAWRRHLAAAVMRVEALGAADEDLLHSVLTVGFADLVAFTALSNGLDDTELGDLVERFEERCVDLVTAGGGRAIKTLGDSVLFVAETPSVGVEIGLQVIEKIGRDKNFPDVRVGMATGSVIGRLGDVFGPPVNLAARLTTVARRNRIILDHASADLLSEEFETRTLPPRTLRGFGNVEPVTVRRRWSYTGR